MLAAAEHPGIELPVAEAIAADPRARENKGKTYGGVDYYGSTREELRKRAAKLGVRGRSTMTKDELAEAIAR